MLNPKRESKYWVSKWNSWCDRIDLTPYRGSSKVQNWKDRKLCLVLHHGISLLGLLWWALLIWSASHTTQCPTRCTAQEEKLLLSSVALMQFLGSIRGAALPTGFVFFDSPAQLRSPLSSARDKQTSAAQHWLPFFCRKLKKICVFSSPWYNTLSRLSTHRYTP